MVHVIGRYSPVSEASGCDSYQSHAWCENYKDDGKFVKTQDICIRLGTVG